MCQPPQPLGVLDMIDRRPRAYLAAVFASIGFTSLFNSSGNPAMSVPLAMVLRRASRSACSSSRRFGDEATLFRLASQLETAHPWTYPPPLAG